MGEEYSPFVQQIRDAKQAELNEHRRSTRFRNYLEDKVSSYQEIWTQKKAERAARRELQDIERAAMQEQRAIEKAAMQEQKRIEKAQRDADRQAQKEAEAEQRRAKAETRRVQKAAEKEAKKAYDDVFEDDFAVDHDVQIIDESKPVKIPKRITRAKSEELVEKEISSFSGFKQHIDDYQSIRKQYKAGKEDGKAVRAKEQAAKKSENQKQKEEDAYKKGYRKGSTSVAERTSEKIQKAGKVASVAASKTEKGTKSALKTGKKVATQVFDAMDGSSPFFNTQPVTKLSKRIGTAQKSTPSKRILKGETGHPVRHKKSRGTVNKSKGSPTSRKSIGSINSRSSGNLTKRSSGGVISSGTINSKKSSGCITGCNKQKKAKGFGMP